MCTHKIPNCNFEPYCTLCGFFYGIPFNARHVVKFNPVDKSLTEIGPDLGEGEGKWSCGVLANTGSIYCAPHFADHILKIDTIQGTVETLNDVELPEETGDALWASGALATDNYIYYMPCNARRIMRLNPDNDTLSSVGDDLGGDECKYSETVVGNDDCVSIEERRECRRQTHLQNSTIFPRFRPVEI